MSDENQEEIKEEKPAEEKTLQDVMASGGIFQSPLFWGVMIFIPIAMTLFISVRQASHENAVIEAPVEKVVQNPGVTKNTKPRAGRGGAPR